MSTQAEAEARHKERLKLLTSEAYDKASPAERAAAANGVGPESWPQWLRDLLDSPALCYGVSLRPAADRHDFDYSVGLTEKDKIAADKRFGLNCVRLVKFVIPWWSPRRYLALMRTKTCYIAVRRGGNKAFWTGKNKPEEMA